MGKSKISKEKKFDRNVEISAPILDPEIIRAIHTPPKGQRLDIKHGGFKALLSDLNPQDSIDELAPLNDHHIPSYIGISCAVSGYSNYSSYSKRPDEQESTKSIQAKTKPNSNSRASSPNGHPITHITIDKNNIQSPDEERRELTEKLTASATERQRSPSPCVLPPEDDRHHGAYVGARYCPLPPPSKLVNKHIPLLGIDDDQDPDEVVEDDANKVEKKIASLYGDEFVEDWRESMTHKAKKEHNIGQEQADSRLQSPKDLVTLKPTPVVEPSVASSSQPIVDVPTPNIKVLAGVEKQFLNKLLTDENPPRPSPSPEFTHKTVETTVTSEKVSQLAPTLASQVEQQQSRQQNHEQQLQPSPSPSPSPSPAPAPAPALSPSPPMSPDSGKSQSFADDDLMISETPQVGEEHIEYEIRAQSPVNNESSPVKIPQPLEVAEDETQSQQRGQKLVTFSPEIAQVFQEEKFIEEEQQNIVDDVAHKLEDKLGSSDSHDGRHYLGLLEIEKSFILKEIEKAETILQEKDELSPMEDDVLVGRIRSAVGKANLLINKKFKQFEELCEANINNNAEEEFATLNDDLAGFWDMLSIQISDVRKSFETMLVRDLIKSEARDKIIGDDSSKAVKDKTQTNKHKLSAQKDQERRERLQGHINLIKQSQAAKRSAENLLEASSVLVDTDEFNNGQSGGDLRGSQEGLESVGAGEQATEVLLNDSPTASKEQPYSLMGVVETSPELNSAEKHEVNLDKSETFSEQKEVESTSTNLVDFD